MEAIRRIVGESPHIKVLVLSASAEEPDVLEAVKVVQNHVQSILSKRYELMRYAIRRGLDRS